MNIKTFENELNPEFVNKARNLFTLSRIQGHKLSTIDNKYEFNTISNISKVTLDSKYNVLSTSCNCKSKYLYCEHTVATFFAIKEYLLKENNTNSTSFNKESVNKYILDLDSIAFYNPSKLLDDLKKLINVIKNESNQEEYLSFYLKHIKERYNNDSLYINNIAPISRQISYSSLLSLTNTLHNEGYNLSFSLSMFIQNGLNEDILKDLFKDLFLTLILDILDNPIITTYPSYDKVVSNFDINSKEYIYFNLIKMLVSQHIDTYFINKLKDNNLFSNTFIDKLFYALFLNKYNLDLEKDEKIIYYALKYSLNIEHLYDKYNLDNIIENNINKISLSSLINNPKIIKYHEELIKDNLNYLINNELENTKFNYPITSINLYKLINKLSNICIFDLDFNKFNFLIKYIITTCLSNDKYLHKLEENKYIYFSIDTAKIYVIKLLINEVKIIYYDYQLEPLDLNEYEELLLPIEYDDIYNSYLDDIHDLIPEIQKNKKLKQLNNLQKYLLSTLITNDIKNNLKVELTFNTKKKYIRKEGIKLRLKIGTTKYYYVNNLIQFFSNIKEDNNQVFGKNNIFNLGINNFDEYSKDLISELTPLINDEINDKELIIDSNTLIKIFSIATNTYIDITYRNVDYTMKVLNDTINPTINVNEDGIIFSSELNNNSIIISSVNNDYLLDFNNRTIRQLKYKNEKIKNIIYFLIKNNNYFETNDIKETWIESIYPLIYDSANINKIYLENNPLKLLEIHCYLDINEENVISVNSKYFYDDKEITDFDYITQSKINNYLNLLKLLGFNNNMISDLDLVGDFLKKDLSNLKEIAKVYISEDLNNKKIISFNNYNIYLRQNNNMLNVIFEKSQFSDEELYNIIQAYKKKKRYTFLKGKVIEFDEEKMKNLINAIEDFHLDEKHLSREVNNPFYNVLKINNYSSLSCFEIEDKLSKVLNDIFNYKEAKFKPNSQLRSIMRPYQIEAFKWLKMLNKYNLGGILADDMGLGKTLETIALLDSEVNDLPSIIISPKSLIYNWERELSKWPTTLIPYVIVGNKRERERILNDNFKPGNVFIISYDTLRNDLEIFEGKKFNYVILDEAQAIKNMQALKTKSVKMINALNKLVLTGTPIENSVADLWSIFDFLMPNYLFSYDRFRNEIEKGILMNDDESYKRIISKTKPFILRRKKKDVLKDLPDKIEETILINMNVEQRKIYDSYLLQTKNAIRNNEKNKILVLSLLTRLRQLCISPSLVLDEQIESEKINYTVQMINNLINTDHKVLIFSQFVSALDLIQKELDNLKIPYFIITGDTSSKKRLEMSEEFNKRNSKEKVFLISLKAGGTGLNLIGADTVIHLDPWWNVAIEDQASDRAHRIGQERKVNIFKLVMKDSIEEKVIELQKNKKEIADKIISIDVQNEMNLSFDDYDYLLS